MIIEQIKASIPLAQEVASYGIELKKSGSLLVGLCPFHEERTGSFKIYEDDHHYHCFGCGAHGDLLDFKMEMESWNLNSTINYFADRLGITERSSRSKVPAEHYNALQWAAEAFFGSRLNPWSYHSRAASDYITSRFSPYILDRHLIGISPCTGKGDELTRYLIDEKGCDLKTLVDVGLSTKNGKDFFKNRVMIPIFNDIGVVVGFGGRALPWDDSTPKYINTPDTLAFTKGKVLYGIECANREDEVVLVEGYFDAIALRAQGVFGVAFMGCALTPEQARLLKSKSKGKIIVGFDGDEAGRKNAFKSLYLLRGLSDVWVANIDDGQDPETIDWLNVELISGDDFVLAHIAMEMGHEPGPSLKSSLIIDCVPYLDSMTPVERFEMFDKISSVLNTPPDAVKETYSINKPSDTTKVKPITPKTQSPAQTATGVENYIVWICMMLPSWFEGNKGRVFDVVTNELNIEILKNISDSKTLSEQAEEHLERLLDAFSSVDSALITSKECDRALGELKDYQNQILLRSVANQQRYAQNGTVAELRGVVQNALS